MNWNVNSDHFDDKTWRIENVQIVKRVDENKYRIFRGSAFLTSVKKLDNAKEIAKILINDENN